MKEVIRQRLREEIEGIPKGQRTDPVVKETIRCTLYAFLKEQGLRPVPAFRNPRYPEGPVDIAGLDADGGLNVAFCSSPTIELEGIKSLERVQSEKKYVISFSENRKKVDMSTFFLKPGIEHIRVFE